MKRLIENERFDEERALYGSNDLIVRGVSFDGPADGESALKESANIEAEHCYCNLRYPFWHIRGLKISDTEMTQFCRAAIWYSEDIEISHTKMLGIKAVRECARVKIKDCEIVSPEFGWFVNGIEMTDCTAQSEYFMMRSKDIKFKNVKFEGKYSFQYIENAVFENCEFQTKDAFWHGKNILVKNCIVRGEYLAWYSDGLTLENCTIIGTQPFCYCKDLKLINCKMLDADLAFEKSDVEAEITTPVISIKNPYRGSICVPKVGEIIRTDVKSVCSIIITENKKAV
ncbi:MAG: DUF3737 family protein [Clostridia bacterium]|nr:DUF3737 family protein [Clostridia bacterium]